MTPEHVEEASQEKSPSDAKQKPMCFASSKIGTQAAATTVSYTASPRRGGCGGGRGYQSEDG